MKKLLAPIVLAVSLLLIPANINAEEVFVANFQGAQEVPAVASPGTGTGTVTLNGNMLTFNITFAGLLSPVVDAHIHCCSPAGANGPVAIGFPSTGFPLGVTSGSYSNTFDLLNPSIYTAAFLAAGGGTAAGAAARLTDNLRSGMTYLNIHTSMFPGGEIRGQVLPQGGAIPEPATLILLGTGLAGGLATKIRRRRKS